MPETDPAISPRCTRCGSDAVIPDALVRSQADANLRLQVGVHRNPEAMMMKGTTMSEARVRVCGDCGLIEMEAADARVLWDAYIDRVSRTL